MVAIWGANFSVLKVALRDFPEVSFNALRLLLAATVFLVAIAVQGKPARLTGREWQRVAVLGVIGHFLYQLCFLGGVARTPVANSSLIFGCTPVAVALMSAAAGYERVTPVRLMGALLSFVGIYIIAGHRAAISGSTALGDAMVFAGMLCWSLYSVLAQPLLKRHSPLVVTGWSIAIGAALYTLIAIPGFRTTPWREISTLSWVLMAASSLLALAFSYMVWYTAVQRIGSSRTAIYSNLTPIAAMIVAALWLREPIGVRQVLGAVTILGGVFVTRLAASTAPPEG